MTPEWMIDATRSGYALFFVAGLTFLVIFGRRLWFDGTISRLALVLGSLFWVWIANSTVRVGWFVLSRKFPTEGFTAKGEPQNEWLWTHKWIMAQETGWLALIVGLLLAHYLKPFTWKEFGLTLGVIAAGVGYLTF